MYFVLFSTSRIHHFRLVLCIIQYFIVLCIYYVLCIVPPWEPSRERECRTEVELTSLQIVVAMRFTNLASQAHESRGVPMLTDCSSTPTREVTGLAANPSSAYAHALGCTRMLHKYFKILLDGVMLLCILGYTKPYLAQSSSVVIYRTLSYPVVPCRRLS